jgi:hypothetical protein
MLADARTPANTFVVVSVFICVVTQRSTHTGKKEVTMSDKISAELAAAMKQAMEIEASNGVDKQDDPAYEAVPLKPALQLLATVTKTVENPDAKYKHMDYKLAPNKNVYALCTGNVGLTQVQKRGQRGWSKLYINASVLRAFAEAALENKNATVCIHLNGEQNGPLTARLEQPATRAYIKARDEGNIGSKGITASTLEQTLKKLIDGGSL